MAEYLVRDIKLGLSATPETTYNAVKVLGSDYLGFQMSGRAFPVPDREKFDDTGKIGAGNEFATVQNSGYVLPATMEISDDVNSDIAGILLRRALGGADTVPAGADILEAGIAFRHKFSMLNNTVSRQLPSSSVVYSLGGFDLVWGGCVVDTFQLAQTGAGVPTFTAGLVSSGLYKRISAISPAFGSVPAPIAPNYMLGAETEVEFTDGTGLYSVTGALRLKSFTLTLNNNHITDDRRAGDPRVLISDIHKGWYVGRMLHGDRSVTAEMTVMLDDALREYLDADNDSTITGFKLRTKGYYIGASTVNQYQFTITVPKCYFRTPRIGDEGGNAVVTLGTFPVQGASFGLITGEIVNGVATAIV